MIVQMGLKFIKHRPVLFIGAFITLLLGAFLIGNTALAMAAALTAPASVGDDMGGIITILALSAVVSGFITVSIVSGTFSLSVALRRREMALFRLVGASGKQIRRLILGEALAISIVAGIFGSLLALLTQPIILSGLNQTELSPVLLQPAGSMLPLTITLVASLAMATIGAWRSCAKAAKVAPSEIFRDSNLDSGVMTKGRITSGSLALLTGIAMLAIASLGQMEAATPLTIFGAIFLATGISTLGPLYMPGLGFLAAKLFSAGSTTGRIAAYSLLASKRKTSSLASPAITSLAIIATIVAVLAAAGAGGNMDAETHRLNQMVLFILTGPSLIYAMIAIANTQVMANSVRQTESKTMRLLGLHTRQIKTIALVESTITIALGTFTGLTISLVAGMVYHQALANTGLTAPLAIPWPTLFLMAAAYLLTAATSSLISTKSTEKLQRQESC
jgi:putative ABC transport system permease protein